MYTVCIISISNIRFGGKDARGTSTPGGPILLISTPTANPTSIIRFLNVKLHFAEIGITKFQKNGPTTAV